MSVGSLSGMPWATLKSLSVFEVIIISVKCGASAFGAWVVSAVKIFTGDDCSEACFKPSDIEVSKFYWVEAWAGRVLAFSLD